jgi:CRP/FNR family transcriptional regulator, nitrogen oxide reductase regulator
MAVIKMSLAAGATSLTASMQQTTGAANVQRCASIMQASNLFVGIPAEEYTTIANTAILRSYRRREMLFMQGEKINEVLLLQQGCVKLTQVSQNGLEVTLRLSRCADVVGALGLASGAAHPLSAQALTEPCTAFAWEAARFEMLLDRLAVMRRNVARILSERLSELEERFREIATENVRERVAHELVRILKHLGRKVNGGIEVSLSCEELAQLTATTLFSISRILSEWEEKGLLVHGREAILVKDPDRLIATVEEI